MAELSGFPYFEVAVHQGRQPSDDAGEVGGAAAPVEARPSPTCS